MTGSFDSPYRNAKSSTADIAGSPFHPAPIAGNSLSHKELCTSRNRPPSGVRFLPVYQSPNACQIHRLRDHLVRTGLSPGQSLFLQRVLRLDRLQHAAHQVRLPAEAAVHLRQRGHGRGEGRDHQGLRVLQGAVRQVHARGDQGPRREGDQRDRHRRIRAARRGGPDLPGEGLLPRRRQGRRPGLPPARRSSRACPTPAARRWASTRREASNIWCCFAPWATCW